MKTGGKAGFYGLPKNPGLFASNFNILPLTSAIFIDIYSCRSGWLGHQLDVEISFCRT